MKKGQVAIEFLSTYGWMLLVIAVSAGALTYMGVFSPEKAVPDMCDFGFDFSCNQFALRSSGQVNVKLTNNLGEPITISKIVCTYEDGSSQENTYTSTVGSASSIDLSCSSSSKNLPTNEKYTVNVDIEYQKVSGGFTKTAQGTIIATVS